MTWSEYGGYLMIQKTIPGRRGTLHYWVGGNSTHTIVFTHGAVMDHGLFQYQVAYFAPRYKVISWDVPGHGLSKPYEQFSLQNAADELVAILDAENINKAHLVGQSMGGYISQVVCARYPERVGSITAVDSSPIQLSYYSRMDQWLFSITPLILKLYPYSLLIDSMAKQIAMSKPSRSYALETLKTFSKAEVINIMKMVYNGLLQYHEVSLTCPILIVYGDRDNTGKVKSYCDRWANQENRPLKIISRAAHNANMDNPEEFNRVVGDYLETIIQSGQVVGKS